MTSSLRTRFALYLSLLPRYHFVEPKLIPMLHRYQCDATNCKKFIRYDEEVGTWVHQAPRG